MVYRVYYRQKDARPLRFSTICTKNQVLKLKIDKVTVILDLNYPFLAHLPCTTAVLVLYIQWLLLWCPQLESRGISLEKVSYRNIRIHHTKQGCFGRLAVRATFCMRNFFKNLVRSEISTFLPVLGRFCMRALWRRFDWKMLIFCPKSQFLAGSSHAAAIFSNRT